MKTFNINSIPTAAATLALYDIKKNQIIDNIKEILPEIEKMVEYIAEKTQLNEKIIINGSFSFKPLYFVTGKDCGLRLNLVDRGKDKKSLVFEARHSTWEEIFIKEVDLLENGEEIIEENYPIFFTFKRLETLDYILTCLEEIDPNLLACSWVMENAK